MSTRTWSVIEAVATALKRIRRSAGYVTDLGTTVITEPEQLRADTQEMRLAVYALSASRPADAAVSRLGREVGIACAIHVPTDIDDRQQRLHEAVEDVEACLANCATLFPTYASAPRWLATDFDPMRDGVLYAGAVVRYAVTVRRPAP